MAEWNVYADGAYLGTVYAKDETEARLAALHKFDIPEDAELTVARR